MKHHITLMDSLTLDQQISCYHIERALSLNDNEDYFDDCIVVVTKTIIKLLYGDILLRELIPTIYSSYSYTRYCYFANEPTSEWNINLFQNLNDFIDFMSPLEDYIAWEIRGRRRVYL